MHIKQQIIMTRCNEAQKQATNNQQQTKKANNTWAKLKTGCTEWFWQKLNRILVNLQEQPTPILSSIMDQHGSFQAKFQVQSPQLSSLTPIRRTPNTNTVIDTQTRNGANSRELKIMFQARLKVQLRLRAHATANSATVSNRQGNHASTTLPQN